jgi:hypothetical protein
MINKPFINSLQLPEEARRDLQARIETYDRLKTDLKRLRPGSDKEVDEIRAKSPDTLWWTDIIQVQLCTIDLLDDDSVREDLRGMRRRMQEVLGQERFSRYLATAPDLQTTKPGVLRADLSQCIRTVYYFYSTYCLGALSRSSVTVSLFRVALSIIVLLGLAAAIIAAPINLWPWNAADKNTISILEWLLLSSIAAVVGSAVSVQRRIEDPSVDVDPFYREITTRADRVGIAVVSPMFGAVFGVLIYLLFASKLVEGGAFPTFTDGTILPKTPFSAALVVLYGFIAGFAEQLIPDALTRIAGRTLASISATPPEPQRPGAPPPGTPQAPESPDPETPPVVAPPLPATLAGHTPTNTAPE